MSTFIVMRPGRCLDMGCWRHALCKKAKGAPLPLTLKCPVQAKTKAKAKAKALLLLVLLFLFLAATSAPALTRQRGAFCSAVLIIQIVAGAHSPTGGILVMVVLAVVVWVLVLPVLVTLGVPASPSGIFRLRLPPPVLPKSRQDFPTAPLTQKTQARVAHPNLLVAGTVQPGRNSTSDKHRQNRARNLTGAPQTAGERLFRPQFNVDDFRGLTGHSQKRS